MPALRAPLSFSSSRTLSATCTAESRYSHLPRTPAPRQPEVNGTASDLKPLDLLISYKAAPGSPLSPTPPAPDPLVLDDGTDEHRELRIRYLISLSLFPLLSVSLSQSLSLPSCSSHRTHWWNLRLLAAMCRCGGGVIDPPRWIGWLWRTRWRRCCATTPRRSSKHFIGSLHSLRHLSGPTEPLVRCSTSKLQGEAI